MRTAKKRSSGDTPRWLLWLVAVSCLAPVTLVWLVGAFFVPLWAAMMLLFQLSEPERAEVPMWDLAWPVACVVGGFIGLLGLLRVMALPRREPPKSHRFFTIGMVAVGFVALAIFNLPWLTGGVPELSELEPIMLYGLVPCGGAAWVLYKSRRFLLAAGSRAAPRDRGGAA